MAKRVNIPSGAKWEDIIGYSRAVRIGNVIEVSGTAAVGENGQIVGVGDPYAQTVFILNKIEKALRAAGAELTDVVRTRLYVTDIKHWQEVGQAHGERFLRVKPATSMVPVSALIEPDMLVEIEATAVLEDHNVTERNKVVIRRYIDELNRRNLGVLDELVAPAFRDVVRAGYQRNVTVFPDYFVEVEEMIAEGDKVVVVWNHRGTQHGFYNGVAPTGKLITGRAISIYTLANGQIAGADGMWDRASIQQQLGLIAGDPTQPGNAS